MLSKLFHARQKLKQKTIFQFHNYLRDNQITKDDFKNLTKLAFDIKRKQFILYLEVFKQFDKDVFNSQIDNMSLFQAVCKSGTLEQVKKLCGLIDNKIDQYCLQNPIYATLSNNQHINKNSEALLILNKLLDVSKDLLVWKINKPLLVEALDQKKFDCAILLAQKGANCSVSNDNDQNLFHLLYQNYIKKHERSILYMRKLLIEKGINENKINKTGRKPLDYCPQIQKKIASEEFQKKNKPTFQQDIIKGKGRSQQGRQSAQKVKDQKKVLPSNNPNNYNTVLKLDNRYDEMQVHKQADNILQRITMQKQQQMKKRKLEKEKQKEKSKKKVLSSDQLKYYLDIDIQNEAKKIEMQNQKLNGEFNDLIRKLTEGIQKKFSVIVQVFGSFATGLCLPESDIDMVIVAKKPQFDTPQSLLQRIDQFLKQMKEEVQSSKYIKTALFPIIKITCTNRYYNKKIDITFQNQNHNGRQSVRLVQSYLQIYEHLRCLTIILKQFIYTAKLSDPYSGGISSYGLIIMIVAYIQNDNRQRILMGNLNEATPAQLLIGFLNYYGFKCNYIGKKISALPPLEAKAQMKDRKIDMNSQPIYTTIMDLQSFYGNDWQFRTKLMIEDPLNPENNIGKSTHKIRQIRNAFQMAFVCIHTNKQCGKKQECQSYNLIKSSRQDSVRYFNNRKPCCIIKRMLNSSNKNVSIL